MRIFEQFTLKHDGCQVILKFIFVSGRNEAVGTNKNRFPKLDLFSQNIYTCKSELSKEHIEKTFLDTRLLEYIPPKQRYFHNGKEILLS